jgi:hypothetical protein
MISKCIKIQLAGSFDFLKPDQKNVFLRALKWIFKDPGYGENV